MTPAYAHQYILPAALALLPPRMDSREARAFILAICLQESKLQTRRQLGNGPARGYPQFERIGISGVLAHAETAQAAKAVCAALDVPATSPDVYEAIEHNDILAFAFARLLLWTLPGALPGREAWNIGWDQYIAAWRPGKPHPQTWIGCWEMAWRVVEGT